jgi:DNA-binding CsgD family transcriptional regulator
MNYWPNTDEPSSERPAIIEQLRAEIRGVPYRPAKRKAAPQRPDPEVNRHYFPTYSNSRWMELGGRAPAAKMLFGEFWYQQEICFLFANTNTGKSILAVQIGEAIARGTKTGRFPCQAPPAKVLYVDFELSNLQFHRRYNILGKDYDFHDNFLRAQFNPMGSPDPDDHRGQNHPLDELILAGLEYRIQTLKISVLIIDNISCLSDGTGNAAGALRIMSRLNTLRAEYKLSILILAHTPKRHRATQPLLDNDLQGSKLLMNFADSAFSIGVSNTDNNLRYLKQIKQRNTHQVYGGDNVCLCRIGTHGNFLQLLFEGYSDEASLLPAPNDQLLEQRTSQVAKLSAEGLSQRQIGKQLNISLGRVNQLLKESIGKIGKGDI